MIGLRGTPYDSGRNFHLIAVFIEYGFTTARCAEYRNADFPAACIASDGARFAVPVSRSTYRKTRVSQTCFRIEEGQQGCSAKKKEVHGFAVSSLLVPNRDSEFSSAAGPSV